MVSACSGVRVDDCPVVAHFSGNDPQKLLDVASQAERCSAVVAVDLNLGCPQRSAQNGHFGAFLCDPVDRTLLLSIVSTLSRSLSVPFFCKIRLLDELDDTLELNPATAGRGLRAALQCTAATAAHRCVGATVPPT